MTIERAIGGDPSPDGRFERGAELHRRNVLIVTDELRRELQHHRRLPFARVPHRGLNQWLIRWRRAKRPISRGEKKQVAAFAVALAQFKDRLPAGNVIAAMPVEKEKAAKSVLQKVSRKTVEQIDVKARLGRERSGKIEMMM